MSVDFVGRLLFKPLAKKNNEIDIHFVDAAMVLIVLNAIFQLLDFLNLKVTWL